MTLLQIIYQRLSRFAIMWMTLHLFLVLTGLRLPQPNIPRNYLFLAPGIVVGLLGWLVWADYYRDRQEKKSLNNNAY